MSARWPVFRAGLLTSQGGCCAAALGQFRRPLESWPGSWASARWSSSATSTGQLTPDRFRAAARVRLREAAERGGRGRRAAWRWSFKPGRRWPTICKPPRPWWPRQPSELGHLPGRVSLLHRPEQARRPGLSDARAICSTSSFPIWPAAPRTGDRRRSDSARRRRFSARADRRSIAADRLRRRGVGRADESADLADSARQFGEVAMTALRKVLGLASME